MAIKGDVSIFRFTAANDTETSITDKIEMSGNGVIPDANTHISSITPHMGITSEENATPGSNNPNARQDTGLAVMQIMVNGYFSTKSGTALGIEKMRDWMREDKQNSVFEFGRFGFRNTKMTAYNVTPTAAKGLLLDDLELTQDFSKKGLVHFTLRLVYDGAITGVGA